MKWFIDGFVIETDKDFNEYDAVWARDRYIRFGVAASQLPDGTSYLVRKWDEIHGGWGFTPPNGPMSEDVEMIKDERVKCAPPGVWMCFHWDRSSCVPFATEIEALRYACEKKTEVKYVEYGHEVTKS